MKSYHVQGNEPDNMDICYTETFNFVYIAYLSRVMDGPGPKKESGESF